MITLNSDRGLVHIEDWADIESRPGFVRDLDPKAHKLKAIIGRYVFADRIRCGLSDCHTPHSKGYIVVTEDGHETNIGKDCGAKYFGVDFETLSRKFDQDLEAAQNRERLATFRFHLEELEARVEALRAGRHGADWVYKSVGALLSVARGCPEDAVRRLGAMVKARTPEVATSRLATDEEIELIEVSEGRKVSRPHYVEDSAESIPGFEALYPENDLRALLVLDLEVHIAEFRGLSIPNLTHGQLRHWAKWVATVDGTLERADAAVSAGRRLLTADGLGPLLQVLAPLEQAQLRGLIRSLED